MKYYYKQIEDGRISTLYVYYNKPKNLPENIIEVKEEDYNRIHALTQNAPVDTFESVYYLDAETETYLPRERTKEEKVDWYVQIVQAGTAELSEVPEEYRAEVEKRLPVSEEQQWINDLIAEVNL